MAKNIELNVLTDRQGRILATARAARVDKQSPHLLGFRPEEGQRSYAVEVPAEKAEDETFMDRLSSDFHVDVEVPAKAHLKELRSKARSK